MNGGECMCSKNTLNNILNCVAENSRTIFGDKLHSVILFGSYARGDFDEESDIAHQMSSNDPLAIYLYLLSFFRSFNKVNKWG